MGSISTLLVKPIVAAIGRDRLADFWRVTDLSPELVADADARITASQFCVAWSALTRATSPAVALAIADATPVGAFGIVEYVCRSAATLGDALAQWVRYLNLLDDAVEVALIADGDRAYLRVVRESEAPAPASHELCFALVAKQATQLAATPFRIAAVDFVHPGDPAAYRAWFDAPVAFGAEHTQLVLPASALGSALHTSDPTLLAILTRAANEVKVPDPTTIVDRVAREIGLALKDDRANIAFVAQRLGMTERSLQRRLKEAATSFNDVRDDVRKQLARRYLDDKLAIAEISFLLGFSEPSAFHRAFRRWTGTTPQAARLA